MQQFAVTTWSFRVVGAEAGALEERLNALGAEGFQIVGVCNQGAQIVLGQVTGVRQMGSAISTPQLGLAPGGKS